MYVRACVFVDGVVEMLDGNETIFVFCVFAERNPQAINGAV